MSLMKDRRRLLLYDTTCRGGKLPMGLSHAWSAGARLYRGVGRFDATLGVSSWAEGLRWIAEMPQGEGVAEVQFWGHGLWGEARVADDIFDRRSLEEEAPLYPLLGALRDRLDEESLFWFRTCQTFGAFAGQAFAQDLAAFLGCRVAGHTHIIGFHQSGLHSLRPGVEPSWSPSEGIAKGSAEAPERARLSRPWAPHTITCLHGAIPEGY